MENITENITGFATSETMDSDLDLYAINSPDPEDEDDDEEEEGEGDDSSETTGDDPPIDEEVVHSPVPTKGGGRPK